MLRLIRFLFVGNWHEHEWVTIDKGVVLRKTVYGKWIHDHYWEEQRCKCGSVRKVRS